MLLRPDTGQASLAQCARQPLSRDSPQHLPCAGHDSKHVTCTGSFHPQQFHAVDDCYPHLADGKTKTQKGEALHVNSKRHIKTVIYYLTHTKKLL